MVPTGKTSAHAQALFKDLWKTVVSYKYIYLLLLPGLAFFVLFSYVPMYGIQLAFKQWSIAKGITGSEWVGLAKFEMLVNDPEFWRAFRNTVTIALLKILFGFPVPIILAILLNELKSRKMQRTLQTIYTFPHFLSWVVVAGIITNLLANDGAVNNLLAVLGLLKADPETGLPNRVGFLMDPGLFRVLVIFSDFWKESGWSCIIYLAAIAGIDPSLYESAVIDGANRWNKIVSITWPSIMSLACILLVLAVGNIMNAGFDQIFNMYNPPVYDTADIIDTYIFRRSFQVQADFGYTTAVGLFRGVINCALLVSANAIVKKFGQESIL